MSTSRRIVVGTLARSTGEAAGKLASLVFFVVIARYLGKEQFGDLVFGMSISTVLLIIGGLGMQEMIGREVAKDPRRADDLVWNVATIKVIVMAIILVVIAAIVALQGRSTESFAAIMIVSLGNGLEYQAGTLYAVFDGRERQPYVATTLIVNRVSTAVMGIVAAAAGAGLVTISILFTLGSAFGVLTAYWLMDRYVLRPARRVQPQAWGGLIRASFPLGIMSLLGTISFRMSVVFVGLIAAGSAVVGEYGAAYRLVEATLFIPAAFNVAVLPWFSRHTGSGGVPVADGFGMALKTVSALVIPLALVFALFAEPVIDALYGSEFEGAIEPLRILAIVVVLWGINTTVVTVLVSRDQPRIYTMPALVAVVPNLVLSLVLIPEHGATGAAIAAAATAACVTVLAVLRTARAIGRVAWPRVTASPLIAAAAMAACAAALSSLPWVIAASAGLLAYAATFLLAERTLAPADFNYYAGALRRQA